MTSDFSEAGEQAEAFLAMCEFSRLEDKAVKAAAAAGRAGRAGIASPPSQRARNNSARRGTEPLSLPGGPRRPRASPAARGPPPPAPPPPPPQPPHPPSTHPGEVCKYLNPLPETGDYATISKLNFTEHFCPATSVGVKWRFRSCAPPSPGELSAWLHLRAPAAAAGTCKMSSPCRVGIST